MQVGVWGPVKPVTANEMYIPVNELFKVEIVIHIFFNKQNLQRVYVFL